jgi:hypothetical protein
LKQSDFIERENVSQFVMDAREPIYEKILMFRKQVKRPPLKWIYFQKISLSTSSLAAVDLVPVQATTTSTGESNSVFVHLLQYSTNRRCLQLPIQICLIKGSRTLRGWGCLFRAESSCAAFTFVWWPLWSD